MGDSSPSTETLFDLRSRVVAVTGCTGLLGSVYCRAFAERGARLVMADLAERDPTAQAAALGREFRVEAMGAACDVGSEPNVKELFATAMQRFGKVDVVVNNAAATGEHLLKTGEVFAAFENYPLAVWEQVLRTNLTGSFLVARAGGKAML